MALLQITSALGDSPTRSIPLVVDVEADQTPFAPTVNWVLLLTAKALLTDPDSAAKFQLRTGLGITHNGSSAVCALAPTATLGTGPANLYFDIRATHQITGETHLVARGRWNLTRPATRLAIPSMPIYTTNPGTGPDLSAMTGLGAGIKTAMALPTGATGAVQLVGDVQTPSSIILPDMTGVAAPAGSIGFKNGQLAVADGVTVGGNEIVRRFSDYGVVHVIGQPRSSAFVKLFGILIPAHRMVNGTRFRLMGRIFIAPVTAGTWTGLTTHCVGRCFLAGSTVQDVASGPTAWSKTDFSDVSNLSATPLIIDLGWSETVFSGSNINGWDGRRTVNGITSTPSSGGLGPPNGITFTPGVANEICFMFQAKSSNAGNYGVPEGVLRVQYEILLEYLN
jgi:hypothetical protein